MADQRWCDIYIVFTKTLRGRNFYEVYPPFETNLMSDRKVIEILLQFKSAKAHGKTSGPPSFA